MVRLDRFSSDRRAILVSLLDRSKLVSLRIESSWLFCCRPRGPCPPSEVSMEKSELMLWGNSRAVAMVTAGHHNPKMLLYMYVILHPVIIKQLHSRFEFIWWVFAQAKAPLVGQSFFCQWYSHILLVLHRPPEEYRSVLTRYQGFRLSDHGAQIVKSDNFSGFQGVSL